jgi:chromosome segregation ATPase
MVLIDSPGFDDTTLSDVDILKIIGLHLQQGSREKKLLTGVIYMRRITDNRVPGSALNNLRVLRKLCGADNYARIALVTSQWDLVEPAVGQDRENQLRTKDEYWGEMIRNGATVNQYSNNTESAIKILRQFLNKSTIELQFQKEFIAMHGNVGNTAAGKEMIQIIVGKLGVYEKQISKLANDNRKAEIEKAAMEKDIQTLKADIERLKQDREREKKREREKEKELSENLRGKENLIKAANTAREQLEGEIRQLKAEIGMLRQEKENSLNEDLRLKQKLIDEAGVAKEKAESDVQDFKKEMGGVQQGNQMGGAIEEDLKPKEELVAGAKVAKDKVEGEIDRADGEMQDLMAEVEKLKQEMEKQKEINEELKAKEQRLEAAETEKENAEKKKEGAEGEMQGLREEMKRLQQGKGRENAVEAVLGSKRQLISELEHEKGEKDGEMEVNTIQVEKLETDKAIATEAMTSLKESAIDSKWPRFSLCTPQ